MPRQCLVVGELRRPARGSAGSRAPGWPMVRCRRRCPGNWSGSRWSPVKSRRSAASSMQMLPAVWPGVCTTTSSRPEIGSRSPSSSRRSAVTGSTGDGRSSSSARRSTGTPQTSSRSPWSAGGDEQGRLLDAVQGDPRARARPDPFGEAEVIGVQVGHRHRRDVVEGMTDAGQPGAERVEVLVVEAAGVDEMDVASGILDRIAEHRGQVAVAERDRDREDAVAHRLHGRHVAGGMRCGLRVAGRLHRSTVSRARVVNALAVRRRREHSGAWPPNQ